MNADPAEDPATLDPRFLASIDLLRRTGARHVQIRYSDDQQPIVWMVVAGYDRLATSRTEGVPLDATRWEAAAALTPWDAAVRLCERLIDGGRCAHCNRVAGVSDDWTAELPLAKHACWYVYDPEVKTFRRSCEGET